MINQKFETKFCDDKILPKQFFWNKRMIFLYFLLIQLSSSEDQFRLVFYEPTFLMVVYKSL